MVCTECKDIFNKVVQINLRGSNIDIDVDSQLYRTYILFVLYIVYNNKRFEILETMILGTTEQVLTGGNISYSLTVVLLQVTMIYLEVYIFKDI